MGAAGVTERPPEPVFQRNLFAGTAADYDRYRLPYPRELGEWLRDKLSLDGSGALLDLGAGPGSVSRLLRPYFDRVVAADAEPDMYEYGRARGDGIEWLLGRAEELEFPDASFDVVAAGAAFHRFDRPVVVRKASSWLKPDGAIALVWGNGPWDDNAVWQRKLAEVIAAWTGGSDRVPAGWERKDYPDEELLADAGFTRTDTHGILVEHLWKLDDIIGFLRSTSFASRAALGADADAFADAVRKALLEVDDRGTYEQTLRFGALLARRG